VSLPRAFASDNTAPVHPAVLAELAAVNHGAAAAYGDDQYSERAVGWLREQFGGAAEVLLVWNGTGANVVALRAATRPYQGVICAAQAHINVDECGAPELQAGCKLVDLPTEHAKLLPEQIRDAVRNIGNEHNVQARLVSITQTTEYGTAYTRDELGVLCDVAHELGLLVHVDGARLANAAATLELPLRQFTREVGVDILSFGVTKNGGMGAEAVVVLHPALAPELRYLRKQSAQLASKMRFLAAQVLALADGDRWLANARHANAMAQRLVRGVGDIPGVRITHPVESNAVFAIIPDSARETLQRDFQFYLWDDRTGEVRWMTNWSTATEDVDEFVAAIGEAVGG
jgi:threonine aldolase